MIADYRWLKAGLAVPRHGDPDWPLLIDEGLTGLAVVRLTSAASLNRLLVIAQVRGQLGIQSLVGQSRLWSCRNSPPSAMRWSTDMPFFSSSSTMPPNVSTFILTSVYGRLESRPYRKDYSLIFVMAVRITAITRFRPSGVSVLKSR